MTGVLELVALVRAQAAHREAWPTCLCRQDDQAGRTPRTAADHLAACAERHMVEKMRHAADAAEAEWRVRP